MSVRQEFVPSGFFVLRTPLLPFDELESWSESPDRAELEQWLREAYERPELREALYLASPALCDAVDAWETGRAGKSLPALVSYFERMTSRPTPFGLFAGCSLGEIGERTRLELDARGSYRRHTRLDMDYLAALAAALDADPTVRGSLVYRPNSSLYRSGGRLRYAESRLDGTLRSYHLVAVDDSEELAATLERAHDGATRGELAAALVDGEISRAEAEEYIDELIAAQLLVSDLQPLVTGAEPVPILVARAAEHAETEEAANALAGALGSLENLDRRGLGARPSDYRRIESLFERLPAKPEPSRLFQLDLTKPARATLGTPVVDEIVRALDVLAQLAPAPRDDPLERFRAAFMERYEDREVPLVEALDEETGIGFGAGAAAETSPLLAGLELGLPETGRAAWEERDRLLLRRVAEAVQERRMELELTPADVDALASPQRPPLPDALEVMATVAASQEELDRGRFRVLFRAASGAPGARLLGRFCHADGALHERLVRHLRAEEARRPDAVFAEIVHLPQGRLGNILCRPVLRAYEIPFLGRSGASAEAQITVTDLFVSVVGDRVASEAGERILLRSRRLGCEVIPRLTSAHNYGFRSLGLYRFLCELQRQGTVDGLAWSWGALEDAPFLPRVRSGRTVLARAQWNLEAEDLERLRGGYEALLEWRREAGAPRWLALADDDNELVTDLDNRLSAEALLHHLRGRERATLVELFPSPEELCAFGPEGRFTHELVIPFVRASDGRRSDARPRPTETERRRFPPGSEWLYAKLYTGTGTADRVLLDVVEPVVREALATGAARRWFFIRYADPQFHLRVRLNGDPGRLARDVLPLLREVAEPLLADGRLWRLQLDTYERELQRYGGDEGMALSEELFHHDSDAVLAIVQTLWGDEGLDARWRLALYGIDRLLDDFGFDPERRRDWARSRRDGFSREFGVDAAAKRTLGERYRAERSALEQLLELEGDEHPLAVGAELLRERSRRLVPIADQLRKREDRLSVSLDSLVGSYAHMHANRLLRGAARQHELVLYDLLDRIYLSRLARATA